MFQSEPFLSLIPTAMLFVPAAFHLFSMVITITCLTWSRHKIRKRPLNNNNQPLTMKCQCTTIVYCTLYSIFHLNHAKESHTALFPKNASVGVVIFMNNTALRMYVSAYSMAAS